MQSTLQQKFEESPLGEVVLSGLVAVILVIGVVSNLPDSEIRDQVRPLVKPIAAATGFDERWGMYAPNPPEKIRTVEVYVTMADGSRRVWSAQPGDPIIGAFARAHWQRLMTAAAGDEPKVRRRLARWVVAELTEPSERAIRVEMILRTETLPPPGTSGRGTDRVKTIYHKDLGVQN